jgi:tetratricopeptide (TPR) repeat protein
MHYFTDQELLVLDALASLNEAELAGDLVGTARGLMAVGLLFDAVGLHGLARRYHAEAVAAGRQANQPVARGQAHLGMGMHRFDVGDWDGCERGMEAARTAYLEAGDLRGWGAASAWIFWIAVYRGEFSRALEIAGRMATYGEEAADGQLQRFGLHYRGAALSRAGDLEDAASHLERAVERYEAVPEVIGMAHAAGDLGLCYARLGDLGRAIELLERANAQLDERGLTAGGCVPARAALAEVYALAAERASGAERAALLRKCEAAGRASLRLGKLHHESLIFGHRAAGTRHWLAGRPAAARASWKKALGQAQALGARYEVARLLQEMGRHTGDAALLRQAEALFDEMGSTWELARTRALLGAGG